MPRYSVSGTVSPDCTTANTGEPAGTEQGQPYFDWDTSDPAWSKWRMCRVGLPGNPWVIIPRDFTEDPVYSGFLRDFGDLGFLAASELGFWLTPTDAVVNSYAPQAPFTGVATVAEYVEPPASDPVLRGKLFLLISHVNGVELASPKKITLAEFDE